MAQFSYKGVCYTFVGMQSEHLEELKCSICLELVSDPVQTSCGHLFCGKCITETETCPVDRTNFTTTPDHFNNRRLGNFKVKCPNNEKGCDWVGELREAEDHISEVCGYQTMVKCRNGCGREMGRKQLKIHETTECRHRNSHLSVFESFRLPCVAGCKRTLTRREMKDHLANTCSEELVECPHKMAGCTSVVKRKDLKEHTLDLDHHCDALLESCAYLVVYGLFSLQGQQQPDASFLPLAFRPWLQTTPTCYPRSPCVIKMEGFQKKEYDEVWFSDPV